MGYRLRGVPGALLAVMGFVLPAFILVVLLSAAYFAGGDLPWLHRLFLGLEALVIGVLASITLNLGQQAIKGRVEVFIALAAFIALLFNIGAVAFGSGMAIIRVMQAEVVQAHGWVSQREFLDGLALGQITPGPIRSPPPSLATKWAAC